MNITKGQFRWLLTASIAATILSVFVSLATESSLPAPLREYLATQSEAEMTGNDIVLLAVFIPLLIALLVSIVGLYRFWPSARPLTVIVWIVGLILVPFAGPTVESGLASLFSELSTVLGGMILAVIYLTPGKEWFEKPREP